MYEKMIILMISFKTLLQETLIEARSHGISAIEWSRGETGQHSLIIMTVEVMISEGFVDYARRAKEAGILIMITFDEAHVIVKDERWRTAMPYTWKLTEIGPRRITLSVTLSRYMEDGFDSDALPGSLTRPESPASSVRHDSVSAGKRKRSISHSPTRDLRLWSGGGPTRLLAEWMMKDVYDFPLSVNVDNISSAYGSKAWCWGEACSWFEEYSFRVNDRSHWGLMDDG